MAAAGAVFTFASFWVYHYINLEDELEIIGPFDTETKEHESIWASVMRRENKKLADSATDPGSLRQSEELA